MEGPFSATGSAWIRSADVQNKYAEYNAIKTTFESGKAAYNVLKDAYNTELKKEKTRQATFGGAFVEAIRVPTRPCPAERPPAYPYVEMDLVTLLSATDATMKSDTSTKKAYWEV